MTDAVFGGDMDDLQIGEWLASTETAADPGADFAADPKLLDGATPDRWITPEPE